MKYGLRSTEQYDKWFAKLKDHTVRLNILARLALAENGNFGDFRQLDENLFELRFFFGGGDKTTQARDIAKAARQLHELEE